MLYISQVCLLIITSHADKNFIVSEIIQSAPDFSKRNFRIGDKIAGVDDMPTGSMRGGLQALLRLLSEMQRPYVIWLDDRVNEVTASCYQTICECDLLL